MADYKIREQNSSVGIFLHLTSEPLDHDSHTKLVRKINLERHVLSSKPDSPRVLSLPNIPEEVLFFDIESNGLDNNLAINTITFAHLNHELKLETGFARDYTEEPGLISWARDKLLSAQYVADFNGRFYDLRHLDARLKTHGLWFSDTGKKGLREELNGREYDLLLYWRAYQKSLGRKRAKSTLQTIERYHFNVHRENEIPGKEIPERYKQWVETRVNWPDIQKIIDHNVRDTITLAALFLDLYQRPLRV